MSIPSNLHEPGAMEKQRESSLEMVAQERLMAEYPIKFDGRHYHLRCYRYDKLKDAANYARSQCITPTDAAMLTATEPVTQIAIPASGDRALMASLGISLQRGYYHWGHYRYDQLRDAVSYACREPMSRK